MMKTNLLSADSRTPSPPYGYSRECIHDREGQIHIVAEFHAHRIQPARIAYRIGIDIAFIEELIAGEAEEGRFDRLVTHYRKQRFSKRMKDSKVKSGGVQYELQQKIAREFEQEID
jgi:hypothetical protein